MMRESGVVSPFKVLGWEFREITPTETGLKKNILDAVSGVREFLKSNKIHNYETQELVPTNKIKLDSIFKGTKGDIDSQVTLYRSNGRGDIRIWFSGLSDFSNAQDELALIIIEKKINLLNITKIDYESIIE